MKRPVLPGASLPCVLLSPSSHLPASAGLALNCPLSSIGRRANLLAFTLAE